MGYSCTWITVRGKKKEDVLKSLELRSTGLFEEFPESPWSFADLCNGWFLVYYSESCETPVFSDIVLANLSVDCEVLVSAVEEHVNYSSTSVWSQGKKIWSVIVEDGDHLISNGELPSVFESIKNHFFENQNSIPLEMGAKLTSFRHDYDFPSGEEKPFEVLEFQEHEFYEYMI